MRETYFLLCEKLKLSWVSMCHCAFATDASNASELSTFVKCMAFFRS